VQKIVVQAKERMTKVDQQEVNMEQIVQLKLYSFPHFLKLTGFKGYSRWIILNQVVKEQHPQHYDLEQIIDELKRSKTPGGIPGDEIYQGLCQHYDQKFMNNKPDESKSIKTKMLEFKAF
jgi:hypothetical protein